MISPVRPDIIKRSLIRSKCVLGKNNPDTVGEIVDHIDQYDQYENQNAHLEHVVNAQGILEHEAYTPCTHQPQNEAGLKIQFK